MTVGPCFMPEINHGLGFHGVNRAMTATAPPLQQSAEFAAALHAFGRAPVMIADGGLALSRRIAGGPRVALWSRLHLADAAALPKLASDAGLGRALHLISPGRPTQGLVQLGAVPLMTPAWTAEIDLTPGRDGLRDGLHQKWRNRLRRAEASGLRVIRSPVTPHSASWLLRADAARQRARGYRNWPPALTLAYAAANPDRAHVFEATDAGEPVAAALFLRHGAAASYHIGFSSVRGRATSAQTLLIWQAMVWLSRTGCTRLDLGLVDTEGAPGLARFKLGTGARARPMGGTWLWWPPMARIGALAGRRRGARRPHGWTWPRGHG